MLGMKKGTDNDIVNLTQTIQGLSDTNHLLSCDNYITGDISPHAM